MRIYDLIIIGAGASGSMAAVQAARRGASVLLLEKNEKIGKKIYITGKGRCNLTNNSDIETHLTNTINGSRFMNGAIRRFTPQHTIDMFESYVPLKTEHGNRVFPVSDKSSDVINALMSMLNNAGVEIVLNTQVKDIFKENDIFKILCINGTTYQSYSVLIATGGKSYSSTGSSGDGYIWAKKFGHNIIEIKPALVPIVVKENVKDIEGLSLKFVEASVEINGKVVAKEFGEMLFTNNGVSGPIILTISSKINRQDLSRAKLYIDFKPKLSVETLDAKFLREFKVFAKKNLSTYLKTLLPSSLVPYFIQKYALQDKKVSDLSKNDRNILINGLKKFDLSLNLLDNIEKAIITSGGVDLKEVSPKNFESKLVSNLYFAGEVLDIDALTGGFNLQIAFSSGFVVGDSVRLK
ncbi:MAG: NAD(P)/FAD-dependent oxidoreductase [Clostridia bacterium]|nr:NAD(P)/FAD-dependent oxidoreductase [Clostridia bacterium]